eukprot:c8841_g1_i1.p1 GENE.c8841_g1_i1~~c8841_g1_i1.p1  ORF type:complete len:227 (-),score=42.84 c8841_g1_i1:34-714(-)
MGNENEERIANLKASTAQDLERINSLKIEIQSRQAQLARQSTELSILEKALRMRQRLLRPQSLVRPLAYTEEEVAFINQEMAVPGVPDAVVEDFTERLQQLQLQQAPESSRTSEAAKNDLEVDEQIASPVPVPETDTSEPAQSQPNNPASQSPNPDESYVLVDEDHGVVPINEDDKQADADYEQVPPPPQAPPATPKTPGQPEQPKESSRSSSSSASQSSSDKDRQ